MGVARLGAKQQEVCIPGYSGHIAGKTSENLHGATFCKENQHATQARHLRHLHRTSSAPAHLDQHNSSVRSKSFSLNPHVPGYMGTLPGVKGENIHAQRFAETSDTAFALRQHNPHATSGAWLRGENVATYSFHNRRIGMDQSRYFSAAQEQEARQVTRSLGLSHGLKVPPSTATRTPSRTQRVKTLPRQEASALPAAGEPTESTSLDPFRWLSVGSGKQRMILV